MSEIGHPKSYKIGTIAIDSEGTWWVYFLGEHAEQGGKYFGPGNRGSKSLATLFKIVRWNLNKCKKQYLKQIAVIEEAKQEEKPQETDQPKTE